MTLIIRNSFCFLVGEIPDSVRDLTTALLTYQNDHGPEIGRLFYQMRVAKSRNNKYQIRSIQARIKYLQENEYVCWFRDGSFPTGHLNLVLDGIRELGASCEIRDERVRPEAMKRFKWFSTPPSMRDYQRKAFDRGVAEGRGVFEMAVGSGKSLLAANLIKEMSVTTLFVVPSRGLLEQIYQDFRKWFGPRMVEQVDAKRVRSGKKMKPIRIITGQSMASLRKTGDLEHLLRGVDALHVDEAHHSGAKSFVEMIPDLEQIYYRFAFSGTYMRNDGKILDLWAFLSNTLFEYPAWKAIEDGFLTPMEVLIHTVTGTPNQDYQKEYDNCYCGNPRLLDRVESIIRSAGKGDQILILVNKKEKSGEIISKHLDDKGIGNCYISGDNTKEEISAAIKAYNAKEIQVLVGSSVLGEGIDIRSTDHLINCKGNKSELVLVQAVGRLIRLYEGKMIGILHDFDFPNTHYMQKHLENRLETYQENFRCPIARA